MSKITPAEHLPFNQENVGNKLVRSFSVSVDSEELVWHLDLKDRKVKVLEGGGWQFQMEDELPTLLSKDLEIFIPSMTYHRVIKGNSDLIVEIEEF